MSSFHTIIALLGCPLLNLAADVCALVAQLLTNLSLLLQYLIIRGSPRRGNYASLEWSNLCTRLGKVACCCLVASLLHLARAECSVETHSRTQRQENTPKVTLGVHLRAPITKSKIDTPRKVFTASAMRLCMRADDNSRVTTRLRPSISSLLLPRQ
jgi:hypothetical protein